MSGWRLGIDCPYCGLQSPDTILDTPEDTDVTVYCRGCTKIFEFKHMTRVFSYVKKMKQSLQSKE